jgi:hypothetical protein
MVVGDKVRVTKEINGHFFEIGEEVVLAEEVPEYMAWRCQGENDWWWLTEEEFEPLNQEL